MYLYVTTNCTSNCKLHLSSLWLYVALYHLCTERTLWLYVALYHLCTMCSIGMVVFDRGQKHRRDFAFHPQSWQGPDRWSWQRGGMSSDRTLHMLKTECMHWTNNLHCHIECKGTYCCDSFCCCSHHHRLFPCPWLIVNFSWYCFYMNLQQKRSLPPNH